MHRNRDISDATVAGRRAFRNYPGVFRERGDRGRDQCMALKTTVEC